MGPESLRLDQLVRRVREDGVREVILATNPSMEGEVTATYIQQLLAGLDVRVTRLARGLPMGGDLEYVDGVTPRPRAVGAAGGALMRSRGLVFLGGALARALGRVACWPSSTSRRTGRTCSAGTPCAVSRPWATWQGRPDPWNGPGVA